MQTFKGWTSRNRTSRNKMGGIGCPSEPQKMTTEQSTVDKGKILPGNEVDVDNLPLTKTDRQKESVKEKRSSELRKTATEQSSVEDEKILPGAVTDVDKILSPNSNTKMESADEKKDNLPGETTEVATTNQLNRKELTSDHSPNIQGVQDADNGSQAQGQTERGGEISLTRQPKQEMIHSSNDDSLGNPNNDTPNEFESTTVSSQTTDTRDASYATAVPLCLPSNYKWNPDTRTLEIEENVDSGSKGAISICDEGKKLLKSIDDDLVMVVCVTGPARTGKSFLLSQFHESVTFGVGHSTMPQTTGIWIALSPEKFKVGADTARLLLLDAEGLDVVSRSDDDRERKLFSVCTLLSSFMIYNCVGVPRATDLDKLGVIAQFSEAVFSNIQEGDMKYAEEEFLKVAPHFLWLIRDDRLQPVFEGQKCSWQTFVEKSILARKKHDDSRDAIRKAIKRVFQSIHAHALPSPVSNENEFATLSPTTNQDKIKPEFLAGIQCIKDLILSDPKIKRIQGCAINGNTMNDLLSLYVDAVNKETDKLHVVTISETVIQSQLSSTVHTAMQQYSHRLEHTKFPVEEDELSNEHHKATIEAHATFDKLTRRIDNNFTDASKTELFKIIEKLFEKFQKRNNTASRKYCADLIEELKENLVKALKSNYENCSCSEMQTVMKKLLQEYGEIAKGPMAAKVKADVMPQIEKIIREYRDLSLQKAESTSEANYIDKAKITGNFPFENSEIKHCHEKAKEFCLNALSWAYDKCEDCEHRKNNFCAKLDGFLEERLEQNSQASQTFCEKVATEAILNHFDQAEKSMLSHSFSYFQNAKTTVLKTYDQHARGPAKYDEREKCERKLAKKLEVIQVAVADAALNDANKSYKHTLHKVIDDGPFEMEELRDKIGEVGKKVLGSFSEKCKGISSAKYEENMSVLKIFIDSLNTFLPSENEVKSNKLCDDLCKNLIKDCKLKLSRLVDVEVRKCLREPVEVSSMLENIKKDFLKEYSEKAKGPMKENAFKRCKYLIDLEVSEIHKRTVDDALGKAIEEFRLSVEEIIKCGLCDEMDLKDKLNFRAQCAESLFNTRIKDLKEVFVNPAKAHLTKVISILTENCVNRNKLMSFKHCENLMSGITQMHKDYWDGHILSIDLQNPEACSNMFRETREKYVYEYHTKSKGPMAQQFEDKCKSEIDRQIKDFQTVVSSNNLSTLLSQFRKTVNINIIQAMPLEDKELQLRKNTERDALLSAFNKVSKIFNEVNAKHNEEFLNSAAADILSKLDHINLQKSQDYCENKCAEVYDTFTKSCTDLIRDCCDKSFNDDFHPMIDLESMKIKSLNDFDNQAKGPAKASVKERCCEEIVKHTSIVESSIINDGLEKAQRKYELTFRMIKDTDFLNLKLDELKSKTATEVKKQLNERCKPSSIAENNDFENSLERSITECNREVDKRHDKLSRKHCETLSNMLVDEVTQSCKTLEEIIKGQDLDHCTDIFSKIDSIRENALTKYDKEAKGLEKPIVKTNLDKSLQKVLEDTVSMISKSILSKSYLSFRSEMQDLLQEGPLDKLLFSSKCNECITNTKASFSTMCAGFDNLIFSGDLSVLNLYLGKTKDDFVKKNEHKSFEYCSSLLDSMFQKRKSFKTKDDFKTIYNENAKGPMARKAFDKFEGPLDNYYNSWYAFFHGIFM